MQIDAPDPRGNTPLIMAAAAASDKNNGLVKTFLNCFQNPSKRTQYVNMTNHDGLTALHFAVLASRPSLVQLLLDVGADPNAGLYSLSSKTNESARCRQLLLEAGADPNVEMACCGDPVNSATLTFECECGGCLSEDLTCFTMCGRVVNVDVTDSKGMTALSWSVYNMVPSLVQTLINVSIRAGADVNHFTETTVVRHKGGGPLHLMLNALPHTLFNSAETKDRLLQTARTLLDCPAVDVNLRDTKGRTALMIACRFYQTSELVTEMLEKGADPDLEDNSGLTALWWACHGCSVSSAPALSAILQTRVPRRLMTLPWYDHRSPLSFNYNAMDVDTIRILFRAGFANHHQVFQLYGQAAQDKVPFDEEQAAKLHRYRAALKQCSSRPRMLQDICLLTVVRSLDHLTKPSERKAALESLELNPSVWKRIVGVGIAVNKEAAQSFTLSLPPAAGEQFFDRLSPRPDEENVSNDLSSCPDEENMSEDLSSCPNEDNVPEDLIKCPDEDSMPEDLSKCRDEDNVPDDLSSCPNEDNMPEDLSSCPNEDNMPEDLSKCPDGDSMPEDLSKCRYEDNVPEDVSKCRYADNS
nr:hypothetical protein BaRGS_029802 [Batillaria attramentaria]